MVTMKHRSAKSNKIVFMYYCIINQDYQTSLVPNKTWLEDEEL